MDNLKKETKKKTFVVWEKDDTNEEKISMFENKFEVIEDGEVQVNRTRKINVARRMLKNNERMEKIIECTGLTIKEINILT